jgi:hypothetical protein
MRLWIILLITIILSGCCYSSSSRPEGPCPIDTLLIESSALPADVFYETGERSLEDAPAKIGVEKIGTSFSSFDKGGVIHHVYRLITPDRAREEFEIDARNVYIPREGETEWITPPDLENLMLVADRYRLACTREKGIDYEICQFIAQYGPYFTNLHVDLGALTHDDLARIIMDIDKKMSQCLILNQ